VSHALQHAAVLVFAFVAVAMLVLSVLGAASYRRDRRRYTLYVTLAFVLFCVKSLILVVGFWYHLAAPELFELVGSLFDLAIAGLLLVPFLVRS
jgi:predicted small integral membrane protein